MLRSNVVVAVALLAGCSALRKVELRPDYAEVDAKKTLRITVVTAPLPDGNEAAGRTFARIARKFVFQKRDFITLADLSAAEVPAEACAAPAEGVLHPAPVLVKKDGGFEVSLVARLYRCGDGETVWRAEAGGSFPSANAELQGTIDNFVGELGEEARPYVAPAYLLMKDVVEALPKPVLPPEAVDEKIENEP